MNTPPAAKKPAPEAKTQEEIKPDDLQTDRSQNEAHLGSSNAFEETENPSSSDPDDISDEKLDDWIDA